MLKYTRLSTWLGDQPDYLPIRITESPNYAGWLSLEIDEARIEGSLWIYADSWVKRLFDELPGINVVCVSGSNRHLFTRYRSQELKAQLNTSKSVDNYSS